LRGAAFSKTELPIQTATTANHPASVFPTCMTNPAF
jgi:hypothetical protein